MLTRCLAAYAVKYDGVMGKMLQVVKTLPVSADDIWHTRTAQGSFADALRQLADVRLRARDVREKVQDCTFGSADGCVHNRNCTLVDIGWKGLPVKESVIESSLI